MAITEAQAEAALHAMKDMAGKYAKAKSQRVYIEEFRKSKKAILMGQSEAKTDGMREAAAYSHPEYLSLLEGLRDAIEAEETMRWKLVSAQTQIEMWRSQEASNRAEGRAVR